VDLTRNMENKRKNKLKQNERQRRKENEKTPNEITMG
jgi:hypothetical protein